VFVTLKKAVLDPQGKAVQGALAKLGYPEARDVRVGRTIEITLEAKSKEEAARRVDEMCRRFLANTVIEEYRVEIAFVINLLVQPGADAPAVSELRHGVAFLGRST
jgi:phosphoribosylformylglycinamidine synthase subunit PurS